MNRSQNHGFVLLTALLFLALVGAAVATLASMDAADAHQTFDQISQAQLEQMSLAAIADASSHLTSQPPTAGVVWNLTLPPALESRNATVQTQIISVETSDRVKLLVRSKLDRLEMRQTLQLAHDTAGWRLLSAELE